MGYLVVEFNGKDYSYKHLNEVYIHEPKEFFIKQFEFAAHYRMKHDNNLPHTLFWTYVEFKRDLNIKRFDHYHPVIGEWISEVPLPPPPPPPPPIPEPYSALLISIGIVGIFLYKRKK
jgi:hypothetical protein